MDLHETDAPVARALAVDDGLGVALGELAESVGGVAALESLRDDPLPDDPVDLEDVAPDHRHRTASILAAIERFDDGHPWSKPLDDEYRTIVARLLRRILRNAPTELHRTTVERIAAALVWLAVHGSDELHRRGPLTAVEIYDAFGVSDCRTLGRRLHRAAGLRPVDDRRAAGGHGATWLGDVELLHSRTRRRLIEQRDVQVRVLTSMRAERAARAPVQRVGTTVAIRAAERHPRWALRAEDTSGRHRVVVAFGDHGDDDEVLGFAIPDAHRLVQMLQRALANTVSRPP